jgi:chloride channel 3/4/5
MVFSLLFATVLRIFLVIISYGCKVPAGIFVPSMAIGASFGRMVGILVQALHESFPDSRFFAACEPDVPCITPGTYAFLGAGAALSGIMHITISVTVIMFELTGALTYILPTMIVVGVTKAVGDRFSKGGIADRMIWFNGFPFLDSKEDHSFGVPVSQVMTSDVTVLPAHDFALKATEKLVDENKFQGFPIVEDRHSMTLLGYIGRTELRYAIDRARREGMISPNARCIFTSQSALPLRTPTSLTPAITFDEIASSSGQQSVDFSRFVDATPLAVHPRLPLETVMELFKKMGPRVILVEHRGKLTGMVTVKDCLKYQFKVEAQEHSRDTEGEQEGNERVWDGMQKFGDWIADKVNLLSAGRLRLGSPRHSSPTGNGWMRDPRDRREPIRPDSTDENRGILDGTEDEDVAVELEDR